MLLYRGFFELFIFLFFLLSKEVLFYGEERLITVCYLFLFFLGFFNLYQGVVNDFNARANSIKDELDLYFKNIIETLVNTKAFIKSSFDIFFNFLVLYKAIMNEFSFYFLHHYNFSNFKHFLINYRSLKVLESTESFYKNVRNSLVKAHNPKFLYSEFVKEQYNMDVVSVNYNEMEALLNKHISSKLEKPSLKSQDSYIFDVSALDLSSVSHSYFNK